MYELIPKGSFLNTVSWIIFGYFALGVALNAISRSKHERYTITPIVIILAVCAFLIAT